ncbi:deoxyribodipyrimidine photo-lyase [Orientia tsutsugamushi]|uniref:deoxyribodipyrimidine photo-lyase n=1 Tax=Orientia tsutsugamushi TaxID=784 RepID=UPI001E362FBF|nr:deoxyribodipyrimidine photo-lyase [Orientia tsutsugamushi]
MVWLRRNLRLEDNKSFAEALKSSKKIIPIFIFDTTILQSFSNPLDRRLSFLANTIYNLNSELQELEGNLLVLYMVIQWKSFLSL